MRIWLSQVGAPCPKTNCPGYHLKPGEAVFGPTPPNTLRSVAGVFLDASQLDEAIAVQPEVDWFEIRADQHLGDAVQRRNLEFLRQAYSFSVNIHGFGLQAWDQGSRGYFDGILELCEQLQPGAISIDLQRAIREAGLNEALLSARHAQSFLAGLVANVQRLQDALKREVLVAHFETYSDKVPPDLGLDPFFQDLVRRTGCGLLLNLSSILSIAKATGERPTDKLSGALLHLPRSAVAELQLTGPRSAGSNGVSGTSSKCLPQMDTDTWTLFSMAARYLGAKPSVVTYEGDLPPLSGLVGEAAFLDVLMGLGISEESQASIDIG